MKAAMPGPTPIRMTLTGLAAYLVAIGLARFAYTPLLPAVIDAGWFAPSQAAYLGAANLAGYLVGALLSRRLSDIFRPVTVLRASLIVATASFIACAWPAPFLWFFVWRFASGFAGATILILAAPLILPHVPERRRGLASGVIFVGPGSGIAVSGLVVPVLLLAGLPAAWLGIGAISACLSAFAWFGWPRHEPPAPARPVADGGAAAAAPAQAGVAGAALLLWSLSLSYALDSFGLVPHMIFLVDFVARGLGHGMAMGAMHWVLFGLGALMGPIVAGYSGDRFGFKATLRAGFVLQALGVGALAVTGDRVVLALSSILIGAFVPGISVLVLGRIREFGLGSAQAEGHAWRFATIAFALGQAAAAYGLSFVFGLTHSYQLLFVAGAFAIVLALAVDLGTGAVARRRRAG